MIQIQTAIPISMDAVTAFCERHHLVRLSLFGSILRDDFSSESDIDVLVEFDPAHIPGWDFFTWADELALIFGREIDLATPESLDLYIRDSVMRTAKVIYERAG